MLFRGISFAAGQAATPDHHSLFPSFPIPAPPQAVEAASTRALQPLDDFLEAGDAAAADFQRLGAVAQDRVDVAVGLAAQFDQLVARDQAVAVDAHEAFAELLFQRLERFLDQVLAAGVVHHHVLLLGLKVVDVLDRDQAQAAAQARAQVGALLALAVAVGGGVVVRSEEHTSELQSLMRTSYAVFCLKKKKTQHR